MSGAEVFSQVAIPVLSGASVWAFTGRRHKLGCICGVLGQPFWLYSTFTGELWGMFIVSLWFLANHVKGLLSYRRRSGGAA